MPRGEIAPATQKARHRHFMAFRITIPQNSLQLEFCGLFTRTENPVDDS
jgi:hypothetical protein